MVPPVPHSQPPLPLDPLALLAGMDIYLLDQVLRGRIQLPCKVLDLGCGAGRNLRYFLSRGCEVVGIDADPHAIEAARSLATELMPGGAGPEGRSARFRVATIEASDLAIEAADLLVCNAVLHFARDADHFHALLRSAWAGLRPGGLFFARLASSIGLEARLSRGALGRQRLPDGTERFLVDEAFLLRATDELGAALADPLKTTNVQNLRCMTTWVLRKSD